MITMKFYTILTSVLLFYVACLLFPIKLAAQYTKADSILVYSYIDRAETHFTNSNYDSALFYCTKAEALSLQTNFKSGYLSALIEATDIYIDKDELQTASTLTNKVNKLGLQIKDSLATAISWLQMAQIKMYSDDFDGALVLFDKSLKYYLADHPTKHSALAYNDMGYTWGRKGELSKQAECLVKSINIYEEYFPHEYGELGIAFSNLSTVFYHLNQLHKAIEYAKKSLVYKEKNGNIDKLSIGCCNISQFYNSIDKVESEKYLQLCVKYALESKKQERIVHSYVTASNFYSANHKPEAALEYELKTIAILETEINDPAMLARRYMAAGNLSSMLEKDSLVCMAYYNKAWAIIQGSPEKISTRDYYLQISNYFYSHQNYLQAYSNYKLYVLYKDSIVLETTRSSIAEIETKYEAKKKDEAIDRLNISQQIKQLEIEKQKAVIAGNTLEAKRKEDEIAFLVQQQELQDARIKQQAAELEKQTLLTKYNQQQLTLAEQQKELQQKELQVQKQAKNIIYVAVGGLLLFCVFAFNRYKLRKKLQQQNELLTIRNSIARDLHDEIGSTLTSIKILSQVSKNNLLKDNEKAATMLTQITDQSEQMQQVMSDIVWAITPDNDKLKNMLTYMREYANHILEPRNIAAKFIVNENLLDQSLDMKQRRDVFLIYKEAVNNVVKYAKASVVTITLSKDADGMLLKIQDDGQGFDTTTIKRSNGLKNMEKRAEGLGGFAKITSQKEIGTTISIFIPTT